MHGVETIAQIKNPKSKKWTEFKINKKIYIITLNFMYKKM